LSGHTAYDSHAVMMLLVFICNQPDKVDEILEGFVEIGITGGTIIDTVGMGQILSTEVPIFAGFRSLFRGASTVNKTIMSVMDGALVEEAMEIIRDAVGDLTVPGTGLVFTIPIDNVTGLASELE